MIGRRKARGARLSTDEQIRQGRVVKSAHAALPGADAVRAFLNSHHDQLRGRPLDLAIASEAGLLAVEAAISIQASRNSSTRSVAKE